MAPEAGWINLQTTHPQTPLWLALSYIRSCHRSTSSVAVARRVIARWMTCRIDLYGRGADSATRTPRFPQASVIPLPRSQVRIVNSSSAFNLDEMHVCSFLGTKVVVLNLRADYVKFNPPRLSSQKKYHVRISIETPGHRQFFRRRPRFCAR